MPSIRYMNTPNHPFWDFVQEMNDHPLWGGPPPPPPQHQHGEADAPHTEPEAGPATKEKDTAPEDPPEVDPSTMRSPQEARDMPLRGRGRYGGRDRHCREERQAHREERHANREERRAGRHSPEGRCGRGDRPPRGDWNPFGAPAFGFGHPFWARGPGPEHQGPPGFGPPGHGPPGHGDHPPHHDGFGRGFRGGRGPWGGRGDHHHGPHRGPHGPRGRHGPPPAFNLQEFIKSLSERVGMNLNGAAEGLGLERFMNGNDQSETDFEPKTDIFERASEYTIHISLPGAKKEDVGVDWDGENSTLRIAGVVHRPGVDEEMLQQLVVDGRKREVGVFEKSIKLGTRNEPANIDIAGIKAKMVDGVLVVRVPKLEIEHQKRDVPISSSNTTPSPQRTGTTTVFDADHEIEMRDAEEEEVEEQPVVEKTQSAAAVTDKGKSKEAEYRKEKEQQQHASTSAAAVSTEEPLPVYQAYTPTIEAEREESDWENYGSEEEGEYVKINVD